MALDIAYSNVASAIGQGYPYAITTWTIPTCSKLVVFVGIGDTVRVPTGVTWNSVSMTQIATVDDANWVGITGYYLDSPDIGNYTLSIASGDSDASQIGVCIIALTDAETGAPAYNTNTATSAAPSVTVAGSANGDILIGAIMTDSQNSTVKGSSLTLLQQALDIGNDTDFHVEYKTATGASAVADWTTGSGPYAAVAIAVGGTVTGPSPSDGSVLYTGNSSPMNYTMTPRTA